jgi:16S rRNA (cytosine967-C5)-methyltransferase
MVNAVLRRSTSAWPEEMQESPPDIRLSHPEWLCNRWFERFGAEPTERAMAAAQEPAPVWFWFVDDSVHESMSERGVPLQAHPWCPGAWQAPGHIQDVMAEIAAGSVYAQDPSSQLVAHVGHRLRQDGRLVDLCAAPGGKAALLTKLGSWNLAIALDIRMQRVRLMRPLVDRVGAVDVAVADCGLPPLRDETFNLVILDAPCTGTGTLRRHPELKWRLQPEAIADMAGIQRRLLGSAVRLVAPGGVLLYATCSVEPEENEELFREVPEGFSRVGFDTVVPAGAPWIPTDAGGMRILPNLGGDGFTMHALRRSG